MWQNAMAAAATKVESAQNRNGFESMPILMRARRWKVTPIIRSQRNAAGIQTFAKVSVVRLSPVRYFGRMSTKIMEQTLADLQRRVERLETTSQPAAEGSWREMIGFAKDDDLFREAMQLGAEWRAKANQEGR